MKQFAAVFAAVLSAAAMMLVCLAAESASAEPVLSDSKLFIAVPGGVPCSATFEDERIAAPLTPGTTVYFVIEGAERAEDLSERYARVLFDFTGSCGSEYIGTPSIEYRMVYDAAGTKQLGYSYLVAVPILEVDDQSAHSVRARVSLQHRKSGSVYFRATVQAEGALVNATPIACTGTDCTVSFDGEAACVRLEYDYGVSFTFDASQQGDINAGASFHTFTDLQWAYPSAELFCAEWIHSPIFDRIGVLEIPAAASSYLYEVQGDKLVDMTGCFTASTNCFTVETRRLGSYVVSDRPLAAPEQTDPPTNPPTGAHL